MDPEIEAARQRAIWTLKFELSLLDAEIHGARRDVANLEKKAVDLKSQISTLQEMKF